ncbi:MAG: hypothetical protein O2897_05165 [bacterium]|nr:hypothetical protein [bacterium]
MFNKEIAFTFLVTIFALSSVGLAHKKPTALLPADSAVCRYSGTHTVYCDVGEFYHDQYGRCGCLTPNDYYPQQYCNVTFFYCDDYAGELFSMLFNSSQSYTLPVGCGCFTTSTQQQQY